MRSYVDLLIYPFTDTHILSDSSLDFEPVKYLIVICLLADEELALAEDLALSCRGWSSDGLSPQGRQVQRPR